MKSSRTYAMSATENKTLARRFYEELSKGNLAIVDEVAAANMIDHNPPAPGLAPGREGAKQVFNMFRAAFPDLHFTVEDQVAEGDKVVSRLTVRGTHRGQFQGIPPTGKTVTVGLIDIFRIAGGKGVERWGQMDSMGLMQQLGAVPQPGQPKT